MKWVWRTVGIIKESREYEVIISIANTLFATIVCTQQTIANHALE